MIRVLVLATLLATGLALVPSASADGHDICFDTDEHLCVDPHPEPSDPIDHGAVKRFVQDLLDNCACDPVD